MTSASVILVFLPCLCISGLPVLRHNLGLLADLALRASVTQINERSPSSNLYRATNQSVKQVILMALFSIKLVDFNTYDFVLNFGLRETACLKHQPGFPDRCPFSLRLFRTVQCSSYVRVSGEIISLLDLNCGPKAVSSSSESSSEERIPQQAQKDRWRVYTLGVIICQQILSWGCD
ncbi:secreted phosphoprotein 24 [Colossoma macropomum]|uniref:secreted phosphoprotein 24 n=1 Tax=Colossoma macropomum TaxID=42526 RepID=UPI001864C205|nr:secreted phosphoprotein 24 [Colossoma macropomum]